MVEDINVIKIFFFLWKNQESKLYSMFCVMNFSSSDDYPATRLFNDNNVDKFNQSQSILWLIMLTMTSTHIWKPRYVTLVIVTDPGKSRFRVGYTLRNVVHAKRGFLPRVRKSDACYVLRRQRSIFIYCTCQKYWN